ncbi:restriction endonuclease [Anaerobacterium chartisolvens]|uniref:Restriction endonuclease n=1 Tax=Anaerobacterium chartisolvens TaxID=1297424 RepID=A0A369BG08_9FIRM|nr:restriction endonuclease [Anaerobacterium chartisolvens]RCX19506.1 restriction endonuclease [Anaerobacterium chartisolvens]
METINPYRKFVSSISANEFEEYCLEVLKAYAESESLKDFSMIHNQKIQTDDGDYQIDIYAEFIALSVRFKVIVECKRYTRPIEREKIVVLADKVRSLGGHKGILISTSGFQSGASEYAKKHGIALLQIFDKHVMHIQNSLHPEMDRLHIELIRQSPKYYAYQWNYSLYDFPDKRIYPSKSMDLDLRKKVLEHFNMNDYV